MKALVKYAGGVGNVELREVEEPVCADDQVKLEVAFCGICGTDVHVYHDRFRNFPPVILGHEFSGTIVETGPAVREFACGERVTVFGAMTVICGRCDYCRKGEYMFCPDRRGMGHGVDGAFAGSAVAREEQLFRLPDNVSLEEGAVVEPFVAAVHAVCERTVVSFGDVVLVSGPGPIGLSCTKLLVAEGIKTLVAGTGDDEQRLEAARQIGAARAIDVGAEDLLTAVREETDGCGADVVFECSGAEASVANCLNALRPLGRYTQVGHFGKDITIPFDLVAFRQFRIAGSVGYTAASWVRALRILAQGRVQLGDLISQVLPLDAWEQGFRAFEEKSALKVLLRP